MNNKSKYGNTEKKKSLQIYNQSRFLKNQQEDQVPPEEPPLTSSQVRTELTNQTTSWTETNK